MLVRKLFFSMALVLAVAACKTSEERAREFLESGLALVADGDLERAAVEFRNAIQQDASVIDAPRELAKINLAFGNVRDGYRNYLRVAEQQPEDADARLVLSELAFEARNWEEFGRHAPEAVRLNPDEPRAEAVRLALQFRDASRNDDLPAFDAILSAAETLATDLPDNTILQMVRVNGYVATDRTDDAIAQLEKMIENDPENLDIYNARLQLVARGNDEDAIEAELRRIARLFPEEETVQSNLVRLLLTRDKQDEAEAYMREIVAADPDNQDKVILLIRFLLDVRSVEAALAELDIRIEQDSTAYTLRTLRASLQYDIGQRNIAISAMEDMIAEADAIASGELNDMKVALATMLLQNDNEVGARRLIEEVLTQDAALSDALKMQARWMIADDDTDGAINAMRTVLASNGQDAAAMTIMAAAYQRSGQPALMMDFLSLAADASGNAPLQSIQYANALAEDDRLQQAGTTLISALRLAPNNIDILNALGQVYLAMDDTGRIQQVIGSLKQIGTDRANTSAATLELELLRKGDNAKEQVMSYLENLSQNNDGNDGIKLAIIETHLRNGEIAEAINKADELAQSNPDNQSYAYFNALTKTRSGDYETAYTIFESLTEQTPQAVAPWLQMLRLSSLLGTTDRNLTLVDKALEATSNAPELLWAKASLLEQRNDIDGAIEIYETLYAQNSSAVVVANNLASLLVTFRDDDQSLQRARLIARRLRGTEVPQMQDTYGWILHRTGDSEGALEYLAPAAAALPIDATVQYHYGVVLSAMGRDEDAKRVLEGAINLLGPLATASLEADIRDKLSEVETALASQ